MSKSAPNACLCSVLWNWGAYYTTAVQSLIDGTWDGTNYYGGMNENLLGITELSNFCVEGTQEKVEEAKKKVLSGELGVFDGEIETNTGETVGVNGKTLDDATITGGINWYFKTIEVVEGLHQNAAIMKESSEQAEKTILELQGINQRVEASIQEVQKQTELTNESVQKIRDASNLIASIAQETNMLSLNARIEASRAGESGKGFAVVANHISNLADQTNQSSTDIEAITDVLMENSTKAVEIMNHMQGVISQQNHSMEETRNVVRKVLDEIGRSIQGIDQIRESTIRLENFSNEVVESVGQLSNIAQETERNTNHTNKETKLVGETLQQVSASAQDLRKIADELAQSIEYFSLS